ncbi:OmpH family outer membrane protein [bacterium]|nr:OmpH family outer membrane protein [bacterium]
MMGRVKWVGAVLGWSLVLTAGAAAQNLKIGILDEDMLRDKYTELRTALENLGDEVDAKQSEFDAMQKELVNQKKALDLQKSLTSDDKALAGLREKEKDLLASAQRLRDLMRDTNQEISQKRFQVLRTYTPHIQKAVDKVAADHGYDVILKRSDTAFFNKKLDVTDLILAELARMGPAKPASPEEPAKRNGNASAPTSGGSR